MRRIYLDNSATTPIDRDVLDAMMPFLTEQFGNASSIHYFGQQARAAVDKARHQVASLINARPAEIVFTSGGTEADNLAIKGVLDMVRLNRAGAGGAGGAPHIVTSAIEHSAIKATCEQLEEQGVRVTYLPVYDNGVVRAADVEDAVTEDTILISIMMANNEIGTLQPVAEIGKLVRRQRERGQKISFHTDAVQAVGKVRVDVEEIGCDLLSLSGHKIHAPKGIGALYVRRGTRLQAQSFGGRQERGIRAGTEAVAQIVALGKAAEIAETRLEEESARLRAMRDRFETSVLEQVPETVVNGDQERRVPNISNISFGGVEGEALLINLDMQGMAVSTGSACSSGSIEPSRIIKALGREDGLARGAVRFSFGRQNSEDEIDLILTALARAVEEIRQLSVRSRTA